MICVREVAGLSTKARVQLGPKSVSVGVLALKRRCTVVRAALVPQEDNDKLPNPREKCSLGGPNFWRMLAGVAAGSVSWAAVASSALAAVENSDMVLGPSTDMLLNTAPDFSFTSFLLYTLLGYWLIKAIQYLNEHSPDSPERDGKEGEQQQQQQQQQQSSSSLNDMGHAHIRSYVDSSRPAPGSEMDARDLRNASLARSAAYRVTATVRESQPRIHALVEELASPSCAWPPLPPRNADIDFVAALVYNRVMQERAAQDRQAGLCPRERAALETRLLEEVAEKCAAQQVTEFIALAAKGKLHPKQSGGAGHPPPSHAH